MEVGTHQKKGPARKLGQKEKPEAEEKRESKGV